MKALIIGSEGTPYANGAFVFDIYLHENYPKEPPSVCFKTTGKGKFKFSPNLYETGNICLSLLGTWHGAETEKWNESTSNIL